MLEQRIEDDLKEALRRKETLKLSVLRMFKAAIQNAAIEKRKDTLEDRDVLGILKRQIKQRRESIEAFNKGNREDLADKEKQELDILSFYMPPELSEQEIVKVVLKTIKDYGANGKKDIGRVMKSVMPELRGRADGKLVNRIVTEKLVEEYAADDAIEKN